MSKQMQRLIDVDNEFENRCKSIGDLIEEFSEKKVKAIIENSTEIDDDGSCDYWIHRTEHTLDVTFYTGDDDFTVSYDLLTAIEINTKVGNHSDDDLISIADYFDKLALRCRELAREQQDDKPDEATKRFWEIMNKLQGLTK